MTVFVTNAQLRNGNPNRSRMPSLWIGGNASLRPTGILHRCSPVFMSMATMLPNGGLSNGNPRGPNKNWAPPIKLYEDSDGSGLRTVARDGSRWVPTYSRPVSGSIAAPAQLAPPALPGTWIVPRKDGGVNSAPWSNEAAMSIACL